MPQGKGTYGSKVGRPPKKKTGMMYGGMASKKKDMMKMGMSKGGSPKKKNDKKGCVTIAIVSTNGTRKKSKKS